jgi:AcrR family transcriptional regulator
MNDITSVTPTARGPADHAVREQIVDAAGEHFSRYGYAKTTVSDLAKSIGFSKAYIYKFFDSKEAIGEAICSKTLTGIVATVEAAVAGASTPTEKFRQMFKVLVATSVGLFFNDRKLYDIAAYAASEQWPSCRAYRERIRSARDVLGLLRESVRTSGQTVVMVTHDPVAASYANAVLYLADGRIVGHQTAPTAEAVAERMTHLADEVERQRATAGA